MSYRTRALVRMRAHGSAKKLLCIYGNMIRAHMQNFRSLSQLGAEQEVAQILFHRSGEDPPPFMIILLFWGKNM